MIRRHGNECAGSHPWLDLRDNGDIHVSFYPRDSTFDVRDKAHTFSPASMPLKPRGIVCKHLFKFGAHGRTLLRSRFRSSLNKFSHACTTSRATAIIALVTRTPSDKSSKLSRAMRRESLVRYES